jgi:hypothetical protein
LCFGRLYVFDLLHPSQKTCSGALAPSILRKKRAPAFWVCTDLRHPSQKTCSGVLAPSILRKKRVPASWVLPSYEKNVCPRFRLLPRVSFYREKRIMTKISYVFMQRESASIDYPRLTTTTYYHDLLPTTYYPRLTTHDLLPTTYYPRLTTYDLLGLALLGSPGLAWALLRLPWALLGSPGALLGLSYALWGSPGLVWALLWSPGALLGASGLSWAGRGLS